MWRLPELRREVLEEFASFGLTARETFAREIVPLGLQLDTSVSDEKRASRRKTATPLTTPCGYSLCRKPIDRSEAASRSGSQYMQLYCNTACRCAAYRERRDGAKKLRPCPCGGVIPATARRDAKYCRHRCPAREKKS